MTDPQVRRRVMLVLVLGCLMLFGALLAIDKAREAREDPAATNIATRGFAGSPLPDGFKAPAFDLRDQEGNRVRDVDLRGRPALITFAYSVCEESCPAQLQLMRKTLAKLERPIPAYAISVDPRTDTPSSARKFLLEQRVAGQIDFVLGSRRQLRPVWKGYAIQPQTDDLEHHARIVLLDARGFQRLGYSVSDVTGEQLADDVRRLERGVDPNASS